MPTRRTALGAACATAALALAAVAGCSSPPPPDPDAGTNGIGRQAPEAIASRARAAALAAPSVHLSGTVVSGGATYRLDVRLSAAGGTGSVVSGNRSFELLRVGSRLYVKGDADFYAQAAGGKPPSRLEGRYVRVHATDPAYRQLAVFTDKAALLNSITALGGPARKGDYREVGGVRTVAVGTDGGSTLRVSLEGTPYPVRVERARGAGVLALTDYGKDLTVKAPAPGQVLDYGTAGAAGGG
ncbi:hypothetical protein LO771_25535 [Streptacidiphilus sp. ASG 303]|uniref:hypothetical protein n=1 Tax=Streptacidiphilus sp. ASG 303 TaxID=2896847 RepID=UPI001E369732|nr:hypothetical protein [Streptacidiphilus sp. ASG 303]MCD0485660.1 hypothetical protein [Streptacidiphilus sp. ASG 303]